MQKVNVHIGVCPAQWTTSTWEFIYQNRSKFREASVQQKEPCPPDSLIEALGYCSGSISFYTAKQGLTVMGVYWPIEQSPSKLRPLLQKEMEYIGMGVMAWFTMLHGYSLFGDCPLQHPSLACRSSVQLYMAWVFFHIITWFVHYVLAPNHICRRC